MKENLKKLNFNRLDWENDALHRDKWKAVVRTGCNVCKER